MRVSITITSHVCSALAKYVRARPKRSASVPVCPALTKYVLGSEGLGVRVGGVQGHKDD